MIQTLQTRRREQSRCKAIEIVEREHRERVRHCLDAWCARDEQQRLARKRQAAVSHYRRSKAR